MKDLAHKGLRAASGTVWIASVALGVSAGVASCVRWQGEDHDNRRGGQTGGSGPGSGKIANQPPTPPGSASADPAVQAMFDGLKTARLSLSRVLCPDSSVAVPANSLTLELRDQKPVLVRDLGSGCSEIQPVGLTMAAARVGFAYSSAHCDGSCASTCPASILGSEGSADSFTARISGNEIALDGGANALADACSGKPPKTFFFARADTSGTGSTSCATRWTRRPAAFDGAVVLEGELKWSAATLADGEIRQLAQAADAELVDGDFSVTLKLHDFSPGKPGAFVGLKLEAIGSGGAAAFARFASGFGDANQNILMAGYAPAGDLATSPETKTTTRQTPSGTLTVARTGTVLTVTAKSQDAAVAWTSTAATPAPAGKMRIVLELGNGKAGQKIDAPTDAGIEEVLITGAAGAVLPGRDAFDCDSL